METILRYFPSLTPEQQEKFAAFEPLIQFWNQRINLISRKDIDSLWLKHVLHSLVIAKVIRFTGGTAVLDVGTGGGFPGIPLAIMFPEVSFHLIDSIGKKIKVVQTVAQELKLKNVTTEQTRAEMLKGKYDFVISRAVTLLPEFVKWTGKNISPRQRNALPNGILYLKGGDIDNEIKPYRKKVVIYPLSDFFSESCFETKKLIFLPF
jgi:16S rRNA (guanine527-N7)-methyltransferase